MYVKLFSTLIHSTVWREDLHVKVVWITMLAMADDHGDVWASLPGLADAARVSIAQCEEAIVRLAAPDPYSRTKDQEGRRITVIEGGWHLLNYGKYRELKSAEHRREQNREAAQRHRARRQQERQQASAGISKSQQPSPHTDESAELESPNGDSGKSHDPAPAGDHGGGVPIANLWTVYLDELGGAPPHPRLTDKRRQVLTALYREHLGQTPDPCEAFKGILARVKASDFHMGTRSYQMPESLFRNAERRDRWANGHVGGMDRGDDLPPALRNEPVPLRPDEDLGAL